MAEQHKLVEIIEDEAVTEATKNLPLKSFLLLLILKKRIILGIIGWVCRNNR